MKKCPVCEIGALLPAEIHERWLGVDLGTYQGLRCASCGEELLDQSATQEVERRAKLAGIWGVARELTLEEKGETLTLTIPAELVRALRLRKGEKLFAHLEESRIVVDTEG